MGRGKGSKERPFGTLGIGLKWGFERRERGGG